MILPYHVCRACGRKNKEVSHPCPATVTRKPGESIDEYRKRGMAYAESWRKENGITLRWTSRNHNGTLLGTFNTEEEALADAHAFSKATGNFTHITLESETYKE